MHYFWWEVYHCFSCYSSKHNVSFPSMLFKFICYLILAIWFGSVWIVFHALLFGIFEFAEFPELNFFPKSMCLYFSLNLEYFQPLFLVPFFVPISPFFLLLQIICMWYYLVLSHRLMKTFLFYSLLSLFILCAAINFFCWLLWLL